MKMFKQVDCGTFSYLTCCYGTTHVEPTGLLIDSAMMLVLSHIPEVSVDERREALVRASNLALMRGVTTVVDFGRYFPGVSEELPWEDFSGLSCILLSYIWMFHRKKSFHCALRSIRILGIIILIAINDNNHFV